MNRLQQPTLHLSRRQLLRLLGVTAATAVAGRKLLEPRPFNEASAAGMPACVVRPAQTEGPYFVDEKLHRADIRSDPSDKSTQPGVPLRLEFRVSQIASGACAPLSAAIVDIWHCDALGVYSDVRDASFDTRGKKFLRGYQETDARGAAQFLTIYPGWYEGRAAHIHFKIRGAGASRRQQEFTSQLYFEEAVTDQIFKQAPYSGKAGRRTMNDRDFIFRRDGKELLLTPVKTSEGYTAIFDIGLRMT